MMNRRQRNSVWYSWLRITCNKLHNPKLPRFLIHHSSFASFLRAPGGPLSRRQPDNGGGSRVAYRIVGVIEGEFNIVKELGIASSRDSIESRGAHNPALVRRRFRQRLAGLGIGIVGEHPSRRSAHRRDIIHHQRLHRPIPKAGERYEADARLKTQFGRFSCVMKGLHLIGTPRTRLLLSARPARFPPARSPAGSARPPRSCPPRRQGRREASAAREHAWRRRGSREWRELRPAWSTRR